MSAVSELAPAKVNLVLRVGAPEAGGLHPLRSLFARLDLADRVTVEEATVDAVVCPGVEGENLAGRAIVAYREAAGGTKVVPPLRVTIEKRIPVAAGMGGGSADAAAALRGAAALTGAPVGPDALAAVARSLGSDVPSQLVPAHAVVGGQGELVEPVALPPMAVALLADPRGLSTAAVYAELDRLRAAGEQPPPGRLELEPVRAIAERGIAELARSLENDLQPAALGLRPELEERIATLTDRGALGALVTGSGPTVFGVFADRAAAELATAGLPGALVAEIA